MIDPVDEWVVNHLQEFDGNKLQSITQIDALSSDDKDAGVSESKDGRYKDLLNQMKKILEDKVSDVVPSSRLTESLSCLVNPADQMSANLERVLRASGQTVTSSKKILEVNLSHSLIEDIDKSPTGMTHAFFSGKRYASISVLKKLIKHDHDVIDMMTKAVNISNSVEHAFSTDKTDEEIKSLIRQCDQMVTSSRGFYSARATVLDGLRQKRKA